MAFNEGLSVADALALRDSTGNNNNGGFFGGDSGWVLFLFFLLAWGNNGLWGGNNGGGFGGMSGLSGALTRAEMTEGFNNQDVRAGIRLSKKAKTGSDSRIP